MYYASERREMHTKFWLEDMNGGNHLKNLGVDGKLILERILEKQDGRMWTGCIWIRIGTSGRTLFKWY